MAMTRIVEVIDGNVRYDGRTLSEWLPGIVARVVSGCAPKRVILFGSVARGDDGPDSDLDLLVELDSVAPATRVDRMLEIHSLIGPSVPVDVLVTDEDELSRRGDLPGILRVALREGRTVYERPA